MSKTPKQANRVHPGRAKLVAFMNMNRGPHSVDQLADACFMSPQTVRRRLQDAVQAKEIINISQIVGLAMYQHSRHVRQRKNVDAGAPVVNRRDPICNARMPTGDVQFWSREMATLNTPPRAK